MTIAEFISSQDERWERHLMLTRHDFYHLPEYVSLTAKHEKGTPVAFYAEIGQSAFLVPLLIRKIPASLGAPDDWYDATTPYGYPAPLLIPPDNPYCLEKFLESFREVGAKSGIITAFFRLHPLLSLPLETLAKYGTLVQHGETVYIDLSLSIEEIEAQRRKDCKKDIRKLMREGFQAKINDWVSGSFDQIVKLPQGDFSLAGWTTWLRQKLPDAVLMTYQNQQNQAILLKVFAVNKPRPDVAIALGSSDYLYSGWEGQLKRTELPQEAISATGKAKLSIWAFDLQQQQAQLIDSRWIQPTE